MNMLIFILYEWPFDEPNEVTLAVMKRCKSKDPRCGMDILIISSFQIVRVQAYKFLLP